MAAADAGWSCQENGTRPRQAAGNRQDLEPAGAHLPLVPRGALCCHRSMVLPKAPTIQASFPIASIVRAVMDRMLRRKPVERSSSMAPASCSTGPTRSSMDFYERTAESTNASVRSLSHCSCEYSARRRLDKEGATSKGGRCLATRAGSRGLLWIRISRAATVPLRSLCLSQLTCQPAGLPGPC